MSAPKPTLREALVLMRALFVYWPGKHGVSMPLPSYRWIEAIDAADAALAEEGQFLVPELPPFPPAGQGLPRYGLRWNGPTQPLSVPMADGYWTPWHLADAAMRAALAEEGAQAMDLWTGPDCTCGGGKPPSWEHSATCPQTLRWRAQPQPPPAPAAVEACPDCLARGDGRADAAACAAPSHKRGWHKDGPPYFTRPHATTGGAVPLAAVEAQQAPLHDDDPAGSAHREAQQATARPSVLEQWGPALEKMAEGAARPPETPRCDAAHGHSGKSWRCLRAEGHGGAHRFPLDSSQPPPPQGAPAAARPSLAERVRAPGFAEGVAEARKRLDALCSCSEPGGVGDTCALCGKAFEEAPAQTRDAFVLAQMARVDPDAEVAAIAAEAPAQGACDARCVGFCGHDGCPDTAHPRCPDLPGEEAWGWSCDGTGPAHQPAPCPDCRGVCMTWPSTLDGRFSECHTAHTLNSHKQYDGHHSRLACTEWRVTEPCAKHGKGE